MKFSATGFGVVYLGTSKIIFHPVAVEKHSGVLIGSTESFCNLYIQSIQETKREMRF